MNRPSAVLSGSAMSPAQSGHSPCTIAVEGTKCWQPGHFFSRGLVIVVMSGSKNDADIERAYSLGANSYLVKPSRFEEMVKMMESLKDYTVWSRNHRGGALSHTPKVNPTASPATLSA